MEYMTLVVLLVVNTNSFTNRVETVSSVVPKRTNIGVSEVPYTSLQGLSTEETFDCVIPNIPNFLY